MKSALQELWASSLRGNRHSRTIMLLLLVAIPTIALGATMLLYDHAKIVWTVALVVLIAVETLFRLFTVNEVSQRDCRIFTGVLLVFTIMIGVTGLIDDWHTGQGDYYSQGGLVPYSDAAGYFTGALSFLERGELDGFAARRPIGVLYFSALLKITGQNLQMTILISTILVALSFFFLAHGVMSYWGISAGVIVVLGLSSVAREFNHTIMTEPAGFICASIAARLLWDGLMKGLPHRFLWGVGVLTLALGIRTGPWFVIPLLLCFAAIRWRKVTLFSGKILLYGAGTIAVYVVLNLVVLKIAGYDSPGHFNANFSYTLYGMVKGGEGWTAICRDFPEHYNRMNDEDFCKFTYEKCAEQFKKHPEGLIIGVGRGFIKTLQQGRLIAHPLTRILPQGIRIILFATGLIVLVYSFRRRAEPLLLIGLILVGMLLSGPFILDAFNRALTVIYPFIALIYAAAPGMMLSRIHGDAGRINTDKKRDLPSFIGNVAVPVLILGAALLIKIGATSRTAISQKDVESNIASDTVIFRASRGSFLELLPNEGKTRIPQITVADFLSDNAAMIEHPTFTVSPGHFFGMVFDMSRNARVCTYLLLDNDPGRFAGSIVSIPVRKVAGNGHIFYKGVGEHTLISNVGRDR